MSSFIASYFGLIEGTGENAVCCPFPHYFSNGEAYYESNPSAHANTTKGVLHCKVCDQGWDEEQFIQAILGCDKDDANKIYHVFHDQQLSDRNEWEVETKLTEDSHNRALALGISEEVIQELRLKTPNKEGEEDIIAFPVFVYDQLVDIRKYNPGRQPKIKSMSGSTNGMIIPYDIWRESPKQRTTLICAGEKDMAIARTHGFNAITITGGEKSTPKLLNEFKDRNVAIVYDNDQAGLDGAIKVANSIYPFTKHIKVVTNFHEICNLKGEDITDFFVKYGKTKQDLINYIKDTPDYIPRAVPKAVIKQPIMDLYEASQNHVNEIVQSNIQVVAVCETAYRTPTSIVGVKTREKEDGTIEHVKDFPWDLDCNNCGDILYLIDGNLKENQIRDNIRKFLLKKPAERNLKLDIKREQTVYKVSVTDLYETADDNVQPMEYTAYSLGIKLESGKKYLISYKLVPHPYKGQQLTMIITDAVQAADSVTNFEITPSVIEHLKMVQNLGTTTKERIDTLVEMDKKFIGYDGIPELIKTIDLSFNTPLRFNFGRVKNIRGYLDTIIIGESRTGKSSTADALRRLYELGTFTSLAGNSATIPGLVGGSSKSTSGNLQTRAGVIPQNHMGLIIFEEFGKSNKDVLKELTDIRSSNEVRIARVSGTTVLPALVRMIALTNPKTTGEIKSIASYPNGISIVTELVPTAEDIARYDIILILSDEGQSEIDPLWEPIEALPVQAYKDKIRWVWTRKPEQILWDTDMEKYIVEQSNELNKKYPSHIKLFGTECWKKIARLSIAVAGYTASASQDFKSIVVKKEHIDYAIDYLVNLYDNKTFKFKEYVEMERKYRTTDDEAIANLQNIYSKNAGLVLQLEQQSEITRAMLESTTGMDPQDLRRALQLLVRGYFIKVDSLTIQPTERFRLTVGKINRNVEIERVGERSVTVQVEQHNNQDQSSGK